MIGPAFQRLPCGQRLHLQHGPIDLIIGAEGGRERAFEAAMARFETVLEELVAELSLLRTPLFPGACVPMGKIARRMDSAARPFSHSFITRMAAVAGAVADTILEAMTSAAPLRRAHVNNGGDIALYLSPGQSFAMTMSDHHGKDLGRIEIRYDDGIGGVATSGRWGRSFSLGIADSVTVLADSAAQADVAATLIGNVVDLPGHAAIRRSPANELYPDSDLGSLLVTTGCGSLNQDEVECALEKGLAEASAMREAGQIRAAALFLAGEARATGPGLATCAKIPTHA